MRFCVGVWKKSWKKGRKRKKKDMMSIFLLLGIDSIEEKWCLLDFLIPRELGLGRGKLNRL